MNIEPITDAQYVKEKLASKHFKIGVIMQKTGISRHMMRRVKDGLPVKPFVVIVLSQYFRNIGD
jgi:hypothetical protein